MNSEIIALLRLIDDPDTEVYNTVASRLMDYGTEIIPKLEQLWEITEEEHVQERIEQLIHRTQFHDLQQALMDWNRLEYPDLLRGAILVSRYCYPALESGPIMDQFDNIRRNTWLELNNYMSPVEQVNVFNSILYSYYKLHGNELTQREPKHFFLNNVIESREGNSYSIGVLYLALAELLDVPLFAVDVPRQFIFAYINELPDLFGNDDHAMRQIQLYVDPIGGMVYSQKDVESYLKKINAPSSDKYFTPLTNRRIIYKMLEELCLCYRYRKEESKADEIQLLMSIISAD